MSSESTRKQQKELILKYLEKSPVIELACQKVGISRMTFYRWLKDDLSFAKMVEEKMFSSRAKINDLAESKLIENISGGQFSSISFWLRHNSKIYRQPKEKTHDLIEKGESFIPPSLFRFHKLTPERFTPPGVFVDCLSYTFAYVKTTKSGAFLGGISDLNKDSNEYILRLHPIMLGGKFDPEQVLTWTSPFQKKNDKIFQEILPSGKDIKSPVSIYYEGQKGISYEEQINFFNEKDGYTFEEVFFPQINLSERLETIKILMKKGLIEFPKSGCEELMRDLIDFPNTEDTSLLEAFTILVYGELCLPEGVIPHTFEKHGRINFAPTNPSHIANLEDDLDLHSPDGINEGNGKRNTP